ncbi:MAG: type I DNA topoisomerase [Chloroflexi bacterium]|nr:type I DNA topoisomerase [Chloroflexota bacterium]
MTATDARASSDLHLEAYCTRCKTKRVIQDPQPVFTANGRPAVKGTCPVCGGTLFRFGRTPLHAGLTPPPATGTARGKARSKAKRTARKGKLVIVESPAKARTIGRYLGKGYTVKASIGHVRDLLRSQMSVDIENDFRPKYRVPNEKRKVVKEIKELAQKAEEIYIATDPDREGEAIAWHLVEAAQMDPERVRRVEFHEITKPAIEQAFAHPRDINMNLVNAQQARRVLDRLVGYTLSPMLWRKVRSRLSAGRVQSVALRLVVEREREIRAFEPREYWTIAAVFQPEGEDSTYTAKLVRLDGQEPDLPNEDAVRPIVADMQQAEYVAVKVKPGQRRRRPPAPFITSTLQQEASRRLGFTAKKTMAVAQQLYEGLDVGEGGATGLITYMRTDSTAVSKLAQEEARRYIAQRHGPEFLPPKPPRYRTRARRAQEAHEAIRPTSVFRTPDKVKPYLSRDQYRLYSLIWKRFVASQMAPAVYDTLTVDVEGRGPQHRYLLRASGSRLRFPGFLVVYEEAKDEDAAQNGEGRLPEGVREGQRQILREVKPEQHFTQPPPRYTDATLIRALEEKGIGRPSTYAPILSTLQQRGYIRRENKRLVPTEIGELVNDLLVKHFPDIMDVEFTARMEENLDRIAAGERDWVSVVRDFYGPFSEQVKKAEEAMPAVKQGPQPIGRKCPRCGGELVLRWGRYGKFISCSNFPKCRYTEPWLEKTGAKCPKCGGDLVVRRTRRGRVFYGCANYPQCDFTTWKRPLATPCPACGGLLVEARKGIAQCLQCQREFPLSQVEGRAEATAQGSPAESA